MASQFADHFWWVGLALGARFAYRIWLFLGAVSWTGASTILCDGFCQKLPLHPGPSIESLVGQPLQIDYYS